MSGGLRRRRGGDEEEKVSWWWCGSGGREDEECMVHTQRGLQSVLRVFVPLFPPTTLSLPASSASSSSSSSAFFVSGKKATRERKGLLLHLSRCSPLILESFVRLLCPSSSGAGEQV